MSSNEREDHKIKKKADSTQCGDDPSKNQRYRVLETFLKIRGSLRRFISRHLVSANDIEDIAQEAFLRAYEVEQKRRIDEPSALLYRIAKNLILSQHNKKSRKVTDYIEDFEYTDVLPTDDSLEANVMAQQKLGILCEAVATLPPQCRKVFLQKKVYGLSQKEIAASMDIAVSTVEKHLAKAIRQCDSVIADRYPDDLTFGRTSRDTAYIHEKSREG